MKVFGWCFNFHLFICIVRPRLILPCTFVYIPVVVIVRNIWMGSCVRLILIPVSCRREIIFKLRVIRRLFFVVFNESARLSSRMRRYFIIQAFIWCIQWIRRRLYLVVFATLRSFCLSRYFVIIFGLTIFLLLLLAQTLRVWGFGLPWIPSTASPLTGLALVE